MELKSPEQHIQEHLEQIIELMVAREIAALSGYIQSAFSAIEYNLEAIAQQRVHGVF